MGVGSTLGLRLVGVIAISLGRVGFDWWVSDLRNKIKYRE